MEQPESNIYYIASNYINERLAWQAYMRVSTLLKLSAAVELSAYRITELQPELHMVVCVVGMKPAEQIHQQLVQALKEGEPTAISADRLLFLAQRHIQKAQEAPWVESHTPKYVYLNRHQRRKRNH